MSETTPSHDTAETRPDDKKPKIHRVCTQCNNMFEVPFDKFETKLCSNCHKG